MKRRRRWWLAGAAGVVAAVSLLMVPAFGVGPVIEELGVLRLHLDSNGDRVIFDPTAPGSNQTQTLIAPNCKLPTTGSLVSFAASGTPANKNPFPGMVNHRIGVGQTGEGTGEPCARINKDKTQALTLSLAGALDGRAVDYAEIDLGFKFNGEATLQLFRSGVKVGADIPVPCSGASDCGPDSGGSDNERVILFLDPADNPGAGHWRAFQMAGVFDTIVIRPSETVPPAKGVVSLEGGFNGSPPGPLGEELETPSDPLATDDTLFHVVDAFDGEITCGQTENLEGSDAALTITRGDDTDGGCKGVAERLLYNFEAGTEGTELFVDFDTEQVIDEPEAVVAQFLEVITWEIGSPPAAPPQHRILFYDDPPLVGYVDAERQPMPWCLADPRVVDDEFGEPSPELPAADPDDYLPADHTSCLVESSSRVTGFLDFGIDLGTFIKVDTVYNIGDGKRWT